MTSVNPFAVYVERLETWLYPRPSDGYRARLIAQISLSAIETLLCTSYLILAARDMRKRRRGIWLFRLQPLAEGTLIVFNALFTYVLFQLASVLVMTAYKAMEYRTYIRRNLLPKHIILMQSLIFMAAIVSAWCYIFANIGAAMQLRSHRRRLVPANRRGNIWHNVCLVTLIIAYVAVNSSVTYVVVRKHVDLINHAALLLADLRTYARLYDEAPAAIPVESTTQLPTRRQEIESLQADFVHHGRRLLGFNSGIGILFAVGALASMPFVIVLRRQTAAFRSRSRLSVMANLSDTTCPSPRSPLPKYSIFAGNSSDAHVSKLGDVVLPGRTLSQTSTNFNTGMRSPAIIEERPNTGSTTARLITFSEEDGPTDTGNLMALRRLSNDLTLSVPVIGILAAYFSFVGIRVSVLLPDLTRWTDMEFVLDSFAWAHLTAGCGIIVFFLINLMTHPGRYGPATTAAQTVSADAVLNNSSKS